MSYWYGPVLCYQPITAQYCDQGPIGTQLSSSPGVTFLYQCGIITGCPHPCYNMTVGVLTRGAHCWSSGIRLLRVFVMKCFILLYGSHSVSVLGVYISSVRGNPIKVSPRLEIHEKMRNILTIPPHSRRLERGPMWSPSHGVQTLLTKNQVNNLYENRQRALMIRLKMGLCLLL